MAYRKRTVVPNARLSDGGLRMFEGLKPDEKETVFGYFMEHWDTARVKGISSDDIPELPKLERRLSNCLEALCQSADEGISEYWRMVARNKKNAPRTEEPTDNDTLTKGEPMDNDTLTNGEPMHNDTLTNGEPSIHPSIQPTNEPKNHSSTKPTLEEIKTYCHEKALPADAQSFWETMERQGWRSKDGRRVEDWKALLFFWGREKPGKTVSAQQYTQRMYQPGELEAVGDDLLEEAKQRREQPAQDG